MAAGVLSRQLSPAILTYTTSRPSKNWLLGLTAASQGLPIVVAGLGRSAFGFGSTAPRVMGYLRALQIMDSAAPGSIAVVTDSTDTVVVNAADAATSAGRALEQLVLWRGADAVKPRACRLAELRLGLEDGGGNVHLVGVGVGEGGRRGPRPRTRKVWRSTSRCDGSSRTSSPGAVYCDALAMKISCPSGCRISL